MSKNTGRRGSAAHTAELVLLLLIVLALIALMLLRIPQARAQEAVEAAAISQTAVPASDGPAAVGTSEASPLPDVTAAPAQTAAEPTPESEPTPVPEPEYFTISMVGDCTLAEAKTRRGWGIAYQGVVGSNYAYPFANTRSYFEDDYLTIANLECVLSDNYYDSIEQFVFLAPAAYANILSEGCVDFVTLANNHTLDFGQNAYNDTKASLDAVSIPSAGDDETYIYQTGDGLKIGIYCLYNKLTGNMLSTMSSAAQQQLAEESKKMIEAAENSLRAQGA